MIIWQKKRGKNVMNKSKIKLFFIGVFHLVISPVYIPAMILWEERDDIKDYYSQCFKAVTFRGRK